MLELVMNYVLVFFMLSFGVLLATVALSPLISHLYGSPFVPTGHRTLRRILSEADLKAGQMFVDLGCGDGRVVRMAVQQYGVVGIGVDINPFLVLLARFTAWLEGLHFIEFRIENMKDADLTNADAIYMFLMPQLILDIRGKLEAELKNGAIIISHGHKIPNWDVYNYKTLENDMFPTYFYHLG